MSAYEYSLAKSEGTIPQRKDESIKKKQTKKHNLPDDSYPPDGGYGWVIVASSFFCNMIVDGIAYCFGMFLFKYVAFYGERIVKVAWVGSILCGMGFMTGPIASSLCNKYGCRPVSIGGSLLASAAFVLSTFSPNVEVLMITYGFMD
uniref:Major facilitator superfamily (MFS) profile domain-containing protein n=1 Tax=Clastoptera arizonana TaxID=38151 RepID=A0A1B6E8D8_9HEMI